jgi:hypothetical protein
VRKREKNQAADQRTDTDGPPVWLELAQAEIDLRTHTGTGGPHDALDHLLKMEARMKAEYPDMPFEVKSEFSARLNARGYTEAAWNAAIVWVESTDWYRLRGRHLD